MAAPGAFAVLRDTAPGGERYRREPRESSTVKGCDPRRKRIKSLTSRNPEPLSPEAAEITENDRLPKCLCYRCMYNLENFYDFRTACVNAVALLERYLPPSELAHNGDKSNYMPYSNVHPEFLKEKENIPMLIPEAPIVNPNAALGTPPRLNSDGEADNEIEELLENSGTDEEATIIDDSDRKSDEYEMDMETNPSDFLEMTPMVTEDNEETSSKNMPMVTQESTVFQHTSEQHEVYVCSLCNKAFSSKGHLSLHARIHVGAGDVIGEKVITDDHTSYKRPYQCDLCNKSYSTAKHRWGHVSTTHRGHPAVTCGYCSRIYSTRTNLEEHIKSRHAGLPAPSELPNPLFRSETKCYCKMCSKKFTSIADLNIHSRICIGQRIELQVQQDIKSESHNSKSLIDTSDISSMDTDDEHKGFKNAEAKLAKNPQLTILKQALTKGSGLKRDLDDKTRANCSPQKLVKTDGCEMQKRWYCEMCPQSFTSVENLKEHEITHDADKPYICILCKKDFTLKSSLSRHILVSHGDFTLKSSLSRHILVSHGVDPCPFIDSDKCLKRVVLTQSWGQQIPIPMSDQKDAKEPSEFALSPETNVENEDEDQERSNHENMVEMETVFVCEICTRDFNDRASLWLHIRATHKECAAFACGVCLKICSDNTQLLSHVNMYHGGSKLLVSEQRRYSCTICGRQHDSRKKLIAHVSIHNVNPAYDPANFVQLNSNYYNETLNGNEVSENILEFGDGDEGEKIDCYICYKSFPNEDHLIRHQRNAHKFEQMAPIVDAIGNGNPGNMNGTGNRAQYHLFFVCELCGSSHPSKWERWLHVSSTHSNEPSIKCERDDCGKIFATKALRNEHVHHHHSVQGPSPNTCEVCGKLWGSRVDYWKHVMGVHSDTVPLICGVCLKVFPNVLQLKTHVQTKHWPLTNGDFSCDICGRPYSNKSKMSRHRKIHGLEIDGYDNNSINDALNESSKYEHSVPPEMDLTCELCADMKFPNLESLCSHRRIVHRLFPCDLCNKCYGRTSHLWKHVNRVHKGHVDITCPYCLKTSASKDHLAAHIAKIHRYELEVRKDNKNSVNFKSSNVEDGVLHYCEKCNKGFHKRYLLRRHMKGCQNYRKDPGALLTRCRACERIFKDRASLQKHIENHHSTYTCHLCNETITSKLGIMTHNRVKHMDHPDLTCDYISCKKLFRTKEDLEAHRKDHKYHISPNVCDFCGDTVENKLKLKMHVLSLHRNEIGVSCGVCLIPMKDPKDLKKHVEDVHESVLSKPNTCQVCGKQYASKWKAFDHTKKCHGKVFRTCKQCLAVFTNDSDIRDHYEHVHNISKDQLAAFEYRMDIGSKVDEYDGVPADIVVKEEPDDLDFDEDLCEDDLNNSKRRRSLTDTYDCEMCPEIFLNCHTLAKHYQNVHNTDPIRMFKKIKPDNNDNSKRKMRNRKNFECKNCQKQFCTKTLFWNHINVCTRRNAFNRLDMQSIMPTSILETHLKNNNQIKKEETSSFMNESNLNIPDFNLFEDINLQLSGQKPVPNLMPLSHMKPPTAVKCSRKDSRKVYDESTNTECTCEVCGKQWPAKKHLWQHLIRFHRAEAAVTCGVCLKLCKSYQDLSDHLKATHAAILSCEGNNFTCKTCGRYHNARSKLLLHMSIHINYVGNFWCQKCQLNFESESKFSEHILECNKKIESGRSNIEDNIKNENDEKGSLIGDETSVVEEVEEVEDFESEPEEDGVTQEESNSENSENSEDSDSASNTSTSDEEEPEEENDSEAESRSNSRAIIGEVSCNTESDDTDSENSENSAEIDNKNLNEMNCFMICAEEDKDRNIDGKENLEEQLMMNTDAVGETKDINQEGQQEELDLKESVNGTKLNNFHVKETVEEGRSDLDFTDDDGPPVLSPIMPLLEQEQSERHNNPMDDMRHKLSPMVPLTINDEKELEMCELSENGNDVERGTTSSMSNPINYYENTDNDKDMNANASTHNLEYGCEDFENIDNEEEDSISVNEDGQMEIDERNVDCNSVNRYEKLEITECINDSEVDSYEENLDEEIKFDNETRDNDVQIHNLSGAVLMVANDSDGNQILIQQNVLTIGNEDSNTGATEYIYHETNEYEIEEYGIAQHETNSTIQSDDIQEMAYVQDISENEDSIEEVVEIHDIEEQSMSAKSKQSNL
ncbi:hypothetical protein HZH66_001831 [Vespula vulgaris]|uniref:C2H2-type domain-containing protein n=1 Tax=Vespula vulgaris TaxID=7454 RepID=A0A834KM05_VESVU|nr:hypothetical protein HZH66_001831 [Vespula vulgaris]